MTYTRTCVHVYNSHSRIYYVRTYMYSCVACICRYGDALMAVQFFFLAGTVHLSRPSVVASWPKGAEKTSRSLCDGRPHRRVVEPRHSAASAFATFFGRLFSAAGDGRRRRGERSRLFVDLVAASGNSIGKRRRTT